MVWKEGRKIRNLFETTWVFPKIGVGLPTKSSHFNRVWNHYVHHPFWGFSPYFWFNTHMCIFCLVSMSTCCRLIPSFIRLPNAKKCGGNSWSTRISGVMGYWVVTVFCYPFPYRIIPWDERYCDLPTFTIKIKQFRQIYHTFGQIWSRPHTTDFPQMVVNCKGTPRLFQGNLGWWNIIPFGQRHGSYGTKLAQVAGGWSVGHERWRIFRATLMAPWLWVMNI